MMPCHESSVLCGEIMMPCHGSSILCGEIMMPCHGSSLHGDVRVNILGVNRLIVTADDVVKCLSSAK